MKWTHWSTLTMEVAHTGSGAPFLGDTLPHLCIWSHVNAILTQKQSIFFSKSLPNSTQLESLRWIPIVMSSPIYSTHLKSGELPHRWFFQLKEFHLLPLDLRIIHHRDKNHIPQWLKAYGSKFTTGWNILKRNKQCTLGFSKITLYLGAYIVIYFLFSTLEQTERLIKEYLGK